MRNWDQLVDNFMRRCEARGLTEAVISGRRRELDRWGTWLKRRKPKPQVEDIDVELILDYIRGRTAFHSKASVCGVMSHMRCMGEFLVIEGIWKQNPLRWMRSPKLDPRRQLPRRIGSEHLVKLLEEATKLSNPYYRSLILTVLIVLYGTGMRRGEMERLDLADWCSTDGMLRIDSRKVNLQRMLPVPPAVRASFEAYFPQRQNQLMKLGVREERAFFVTRKGNRLTGEKIGIALHRLAKRANVPIVTVHQFRHSCASDLLEQGLSIHEVQKYLGHAFIQTTVRYAQVADPARRAAIALHPINSILKLQGATNESH